MSFKNPNSHFPSPAFNESGDAAPNGKKKWQPFGAWRSQEGSSNLKPEVKNEWNRVQDDVRRLEQNPDAEANFLQPAAAITTLHWVKNSERSHCGNKACKRPLWAMSKHHCRKCGEVYCAKCLQFQRRLSPNAEYDPNGLLHKVCEKCSSSKQQGAGHTRNWTYTFHDLRKEIHGVDNAKMTRAVVVRTCNDLVAGFQANYTSGVAPPTTPQSATPPPGSSGSGGSRNPFNLFRKGVSKVVTRSTPDWQKPPNWVNEGTSCQCCSRAYGYLESQRNCRICGKLVCKTASSKDLLLYTPDKSDQAELGSHPRWTIIKIIGCPEIEPDHSLLLRVCYPCRDQLKDMQVEEQQRLVADGGAVNLCWQGLVEIHGDIIKVQAKIDGSMPEFQKLIDGLEIQSGAPASLPPNRNNMQLLAKHQGDLSDNLSLFVITVARLKRLNPQRKTQVKLLKQLITCKYSYYVENNNLFKQLKRQLEQITPPEVLQEIQSIVDAKAINSACISLNQLAYESLHLCMKHKLDQSLPLDIKEAAEVCEADLEKKLVASGENWAERIEQIKAFVRLQLKGDAENNKKPHPFIRPSRRKTNAGGARYIEQFLHQRAMDITSQIRIQLVSRSADRSFKPTKQSLEKLESLKEGTDGDWCLI